MTDNFAITVFQIIGCVLVADLATGIVHWFEDAYAVPSWPWLLGNSVAESNIVHHEDPKHFVRESNLWMRNYQPVSMAIMLSLTAYLVGCGCWQVYLTAVIGGIGNETHAWCHTRPPRLALILQQMGILTTPLQHALHHRPPFDRSYCCITNLMNPLLDATGFWRGLEWVFLGIGLRVRRLSPERRGV